ncbi:AzlD family protein [Rhizobium pusense]|uniref:AzlD family protein n=1 Tax=Agrobacterium pusense TaxID=648995 RepID=A0A6H0ZI36_9HYPH|nr:AzlD family protein [Agrobacterium pusense]MDH2091896.1 AzlD family protein [Agrobacterium pusense]QIX19697.1 AzlD family protein [Agrobacterium pusense]WCK27464.1 AzlD family protein [Agrobacterium pusense]
MIDPLYLVTIVLMAAVTYMTRIGGYLLLKDREISGRIKTVMECAPGCVLITVIAPVFVSGRLSDLITLGITTVAATKLPVLPTVLIAIGSAGLLRHLAM